MKHLISYKLGPKSEKCNFVGYPKEMKGYSFYNPLENKVFVARYAVFLERELVSRKDSGRKIDLDEDREPHNDIESELEHEQDIQDNIAQETQVIHRSGRIRHEPERNNGFP